MINVTGNDGTVSVNEPVPSVIVPFEDPFTETETPAREESLSELLTLPVIVCCACDDSIVSRTKNSNKKFFINNI